MTRTGHNYLSSSIKKSLSLTARNSENYPHRASNIKRNGVNLSRNLKVSIFPHLLSSPVEMDQDHQIEFYNSKKQTIASSYVLERENISEGE